MPAAGVTLLGEAAHIMPLFTGRGVNLAMLDALEFAHCLSAGRFDTLDAAIPAYETAMLARTSGAIEETPVARDLMCAPDAPAGIVADCKGTSREGRKRAGSGRPNACAATCPIRDGRRRRGRRAGNGSANGSANGSERGGRPAPHAPCATQGGGCVPVPANAIRLARGISARMVRQVRRPWSSHRAPARREPGANPVRGRPAVDGVSRRAGRRSRCFIVAPFSVPAR
ncbi:FAD-dependent oxidoreductase [Burkholderia plantarii]|uniref:FAD-dependent oxidoreductase n=1 Tax=Burkholderia plantarii TaxID=41899 RepID=UPI000F4E5CAD|nr:hypothetical protein [Burkholderia plantarii]